MQIIKIFLASSIVEFKQERQELAAFINSLNTICVRKGIYFEMKLCEELSNAIAMDRKQNEYNAFIRGSDYLFMLFGKSAGKYTIEEFDVAKEQWKASGAPRIFVFFRKCLEAESDVASFRKRLDKEMQDCYSEFQHLDAVKMDFLNILSSDARVNSVLECHDGQAFWDGHPILRVLQINFEKKD